MNTGRCASRPISARSLSSRPAPPSSTSASNFVFPVTQTRSGAAPSASTRSASSSERMRKQSILRSGLLIARKRRRYRDIFAGLKRPFVRAIRTPAFRAARIRFGQISVYSSTSRSGRSAATARRVAPNRS